MSTTRIELVGSWYEFMKTEISQEQYERYLAHYRKHGVAVDSDDADWSELRENGEDMGLTGDDAELLVNDDAIQDLHNLIRKHMNYAYSPNCSYAFEIDCYYWVSYDYYKGGSFSIEIEKPFDFRKLFFCAQELNPVASIPTLKSDSTSIHIITSLSYDGEDFLADGGAEHRHSKEWLIKT